MNAPALPLNTVHLTPGMLALTGEAGGTEKTIEKRPEIGRKSVKKQPKIVTFLPKTAHFYYSAGQKAFILFINERFFEHGSYSLSLKKVYTFGE